MAAFEVDSVYVEAPFNLRDLVKVLKFLSCRHTNPHIFFLIWQNPNFSTQIAFHPYFTNATREGLRYLGDPCGAVGDAHTALSPPSSKKYNNHSYGHATGTLLNIFAGAYPPQNSCSGQSA